MIDDLKSYWLIISDYTSKYQATKDTIINKIGTELISVQTKLFFLFDPSTVIKRELIKEAKKVP